MGRSEIDEAGVEASHRALVSAKVSERLNVPKTLKSQEAI